MNGTSSCKLDALTFPLWGSRLIEASAGTGKTWTIAALYLRLVLGHGGEQGFERPLRPADILVMTFTRAATRELSDRIRARLIEAAQCFRGEAQPASHDALLRELMADYAEGAERQAAAWRLAMAAEGMDDASVHTIDAWCQRMLREHAFDSGNLFDEELVADERTLLTEATQDYWRQHGYPLSGVELDTVLSLWPSVDHLQADVRQLINQTVPKEAGQGTLGQCLAREMTARAERLQALAAGWDERAQAMQIWLDGQTAPKTCDWDRKKLSARYYTDWLARLAAWARSPETGLVLTDSARKRLTPEGLLEAHKTGILPADTPAHFAAFEQLLAELDALPDPRVAMRLHAVARVSERMARLKKQAGTFGFADMLTRLDNALAGPNGLRLRERIVAQYPVALIDEFQDTSPLQYRIFDQLYRTAANERGSALLLIGDPKQSIYGFRGADIYSYLQARRATEGRHYVLDTNYRSTHALVSAVNHWFEQGERKLPEGAFLFRDGDANPLPFVPVQANGRPEQLQLAGRVVPAMQIVADLQLSHGDQHRARFAECCAEQIVSWLNNPDMGFCRDGEPFKRLRPADIAVLVRTGKEADAVRRELRRRGVASVYLSDKDSVFDSDEARDLLHWLRAVAAPLDVRLVRAGLATRTVGLSLDELAWLASDDEAFDERSAQLRALHGVWMSQGVLTMLRQTLHQLDLPARWLQEPDGERRLTNFLHLAELLQTASAQLDGEQALIRWLTLQMEDRRNSSDEQIVRLESDADLVKVVTVHKSKGLEYAVVCLPFACSFRKVERSKTPFVNTLNEDGERELRLQYDDAALAQADRERLREDLRLLYVALTRARHTMWMGVAALKVGNSEECRTHESAVGYLLMGHQGTGPDGLMAHLQALAQGCHDMTLLTRPETVARSRLAAGRDDEVLQDSPPYAGQFDRRWGIGSFSSLVRAMAGGNSLLPTLQARPADDEISAEAGAAISPMPEADSLNASPVVSAAGQMSLLLEPQPSPAWHRFTRGALAGNFLHDQLEWLAMEHFALDEGTANADRLHRRCERAGRAEQADDVVQWLSRVTRTPLGGVGASLRELHHVLPEMEFWLPAGRLQAAEVDALCRTHLLPGVERPSLPERELHGMLMGFADLVFEHGGRYWVLDYKSNHLGNDGEAYHARALTEAMAEHRYDVQAALYMLALHRLLRHRLGAAYAPRTHLGGAVYLFLRGIDGPEQGSHVLPPCLELLAALDAMLASPEEPAT